MTTSDWIALGAGIYGSIVATCALMWNIIRERRNVIVRIKYAKALCGSTEALAIETINKGRYPINVKEIGLMLSDEKQWVSPEWQNQL